MKQSPKKILLYITLSVVTLCIFSDLKNHEFLNYDDNEFIVENEHIRDGFSIDSLVYAFTDVNSGIWHPITWISHIFDCQVYGLNPIGHHWNSFIIHLVNTLLVLFILHRMTGALNRSFFVAILFAIHPIQIESVAWVAERKNVLSTLLYLLCFLSYIQYAKDEKIGRYVIVILFYILGLMAKPMMVTMPVILLLLDFWPLERLKVSTDTEGEQSSRSIKSFIIEKIPFLIIAVIFSIISWKSQCISGAMTDLETISLQARVELSLVSYIKYLYNLIWPTRLAFFYPYTGNIPLWKTLGGFSLLLLFSACSIYYFKNKKYILFGWLWFVITISPVIGIVHLGEQAMADRYMYIPCIGIFIVVIWGLYDLTAHFGRSKFLFILFTSLLVVIFSMLSIVQVKTWRNSYTLYSHALQVTSGNFVAHSNLGVLLLNNGRTDEAIYHLEKALDLKPQESKSHFDMGSALAASKRFNEAKKQYHWVLERFPNDMETIYYMGRVCFDVGEYEKAINYFIKYLQYNPEHLNVLRLLGHSYMKLEKFKEAEKYYLSAIKKRPDQPEVLNNLGVIYYNEGLLKKADQLFKLALKYKPGFRDAYLNLKNVQSHLKER